MPNKFVLSPRVRGSALTLHANDIASKVRRRRGIRHCLSDRVLFWGLVSREVDEAIELYATREEALRALCEVLADEPGWEHLLFIRPIDLADAGAPLN